MIPPHLTVNEGCRLATLHALEVLDSEPEERFDRITRLAQRLFNVPIAVVSLVDSQRQWFKSAIGLPITETPRNFSFCAHAIHKREIMVVPDATQDPRFFDNPLVTSAPYIRFYAGYPLDLGNGHALGTLCVIDRVPRAFGEDDLCALRDLGAIVEQELRSAMLACTDELTRLPNRRGFLEQAEHLLAGCQRRMSPATLVYFDLDQFKVINDTFGHETGDFALRTFADVLRENCRNADLVARLSGDEFVALLADTYPESAHRFVVRVQSHLGSLNANSQNCAPLGCSAGIAEFDPGEPQPLSSLLAEADRQMYLTKHVRRKVGDYRQE